MILDLARHTGLRLAEVGFLLVLIAGVWLVTAEMLQFKFHRARIIGSGLLLIGAGALLVIATRWGHFG